MLLLFLLTILFIALYPKFYLWGSITGMGSAVFVVMILLFVIFTLILFPWFISIVFVLAFVLIIFSNKWQFKGLNIVQVVVPTVISPNRLYHAIRPFQDVLKDQSKALELKLHLDEKLSYGVKAELTKLYMREYKAKSGNHWFLFFLISILLFVIKTVFQSALEEIIYIPILRVGSVLSDYARKVKIT